MPSEITIDHFRENVDQNRSLNQPNSDSLDQIDNFPTGNHNNKISRTSPN